MNEITLLQQALTSAFNQENYSITSRYLLACSGGADSVSLGATLHSLSIPFDIAHVNYRLRGNDSEEDQLLVEKLAKRWGATFHCHIVKSDNWHQGESLQAEAREIRYDFFEKLLKDGKYEACLLAHHQDDQAETLLMSLIKGNSFSILNPMPAARPGYIRPFLTLSKELCRDALQEWQISWREDSSNKKNIYTRNTLRNHILPSLQEINPGITKQLIEKSRQYNKQMILLEELLQPVVAPGIRATEKVHTFSWKNIPETLTRNHLPTILAFVLTKWGFHGNHVWLGAELAAAESGKIYEFKGRLERGRQLFQWIHGSNSKKELVIDTMENLPLSDSLSGRLISLTRVATPKSFISPKTTHFISLEKATFPLIIRAPKIGEKMGPLGMDGSKMLSDIMIDEKFRPAQKHLAVVLEDQKGIIALSDFRIAERIKTNPEDSHCLKLVIEEAD